MAMAMMRERRREATNGTTRAAEATIDTNGSSREDDAAGAAEDDDEEEVDEEEDARERAATDISKRIDRAKHRAYLENSQLTEQDRRQVRCKERELMQDMKENATDLAKLSSNRFKEATRTLDQVYENVCYPREANLDASNLDELNSAVAKQSQALGASDMTKYDVADLIRASRDKCARDGSAFDWHELGTAAGACFRAAPETSFLFGLMNTQVVQKERKRARRQREEDDCQASQPSAYTSKKDRKDAQARRLEVLQNTMERTQKKHLFDVVNNPRSFRQTIENLFDVSFLVRNGAVEIGVDKNGLPYLENHEGRTEENLPAQTQSIISLTPNDWEAISRVWGTEEPLSNFRFTSHVYSPPCDTRYVHGFGVRISANHTTVLPANLAVTRELSDTDRKLKNADMSTHEDGESVMGVLLIILLVVLGTMYMYSQQTPGQAAAGGGQQPAAARASAAGSASTRTPTTTVATANLSERQLQLHQSLPMRNGTRTITVCVDTLVRGSEQLEWRDEQAPTVLADLVQIADVYLLAMAANEKDEAYRQRVRAFITSAPKVAFNGATKTGIKAHKVLFCTSSVGKIAFVRQLEPQVHVEVDASTVRELEKHVPRIVHVTHQQDAPSSACAGSNAHVVDSLSSYVQFLGAH
ncbi:TPA: hypothetical protein N0F65_008737 [Lagenidium giganteum]|uniref:Non-structural maintenance of chromosomes element 4 n=1 Tax=Lagenidium giganteum TaxID=4803 RepID=A0AAV2Z0I9_9STRA|nr:TPA: hypothetical protein N0F65_008737 [Lagenidium giganteum]